MVTIEDRLIWPAQALADQGHDVQIVMPGAGEGIAGSVNMLTGQVVDVAPPDDAEAVVLQRVSSFSTSQGVKMMRAKGVPVIVDMDDDLTKIDPANPAFYGLGVKTGNPKHNWRNAHQACLDASLVTVSTPALLKVYAPHGRGVVLENRIPAAFLELEHVDSARFGWPGAVHSHPTDLQVVGPSVARLVREGHEYWGVGPDYAYAEGDGALASALGIDKNGNITTSGNVPFADWSTALAGMGVGMAPLADTEFNRAKSWLKPLELMACGVPWVGSPRAEYQRLHDLTGVGLLADRARTWYSNLRRLITDPVLRQDMSLKGRAAAADWTIEGSAWRWLEAWRSARP